jgi:hypothetical protein
MKKIEVEEDIVTKRKTQVSGPQKAMGEKATTTQITRRVVCICVVVARHLQTTEKNC